MCARGAIAILCLVAALAGPEPAARAAEGPSGSPDAVVGEDCFLESQVACEEIAQAVVDDDLLLARRALDRWRRSCGEQDLVWRTRLLVEIWAGAYSDSLLGHDPASRLVRYLEWYRGIRLPELATSVRDPAVATPVDTLVSCVDLEDFLIDMAVQLLPHVEPGTEEEILVSFFAGEIGPALRSLQGPELAGSPLRVSYDGLLARINAHRGNELEAAIFAGFWAPASGFDGVGGRPALGAWGAARRGRASVRVLGELRIGDASRAYVVRDGDELVETDSFTGIHFGVVPALTLLRVSRLEFQAEGGIGWYGVQALSAELDGDLPPVWLHSLSRSVGLSLTVLDHVPTGYFASLSLHREWNDLNTGSGADDLVGSSWVFRLSLGRRTDLGRERWRRALHAGES